MDHSLTKMNSESNSLKDSSKQSRGCDHKDLSLEHNPDVDLVSDRSVDTVAKEALHPLESFGVARTDDVLQNPSVGGNLHNDALFSVSRKDNNNNHQCDNIHFHNAS